MKVYLHIILLLFFTSQLFAQQNTFHPFEDKMESKIEKNNIERQIIPKAYRTVKLNDVLLKKALKKAPPRFSTFAHTNPIVLELPMPDGSTQRFSITEASVMHSELAARYPEIQAFAGTGIDDPTATIRFDHTPVGFHAMILTANSSAVFIDPYAKGDTQHYISYYKKDYNNHLSKEFVCHVESEVQPDNFIEHTQRVAGDCQLRNYRLALACTGEYAQFHGGTIPGVLAAMNTSMVRVNGVFERDAGITMTIIANNDVIIYLDAATDPYTNGNGSAMLGQNQTTVDNEIGTNNYDIGHVFSTGGGGIASLRSPCGNSKAQGVTGQGSPINDPFDIDYVAHEMGHQFGGNHTFNNCGGSSGPQAYETGSATTIMGYAGICGAASNVQNNSDDYFHTINVQEFANFVTGNGNSCAEILNTSNNAPSVSAGNNYTIPISTPFELTATGTDPDGDNLTYCWEQFDDGQSSSPPNSTETQGPLFRSFSPTTAPSRVFPRLSDLVANTNYDWEVLPSVARTMDFVCMARDNNSAYGCTDEDQMIVTVAGGSGPFLVTSPNTNVSWGTTTTQTVTWDVANTDAAPISCANVDILLSTDGGFTYPITIASGVPNDGSQAITVPNNITTTARIRIQCSDNIFFDISDTDFEIFAANPDYTISTTNASRDACPPADVMYTIETESILSYVDPITFSATGLDPALTATFTPNPATPGQTIMLTISNTGSVVSGSYNFDTEGNSTTGTKVIPMVLNILEQPSPFSLVSPANGATGEATMPTFDWAASTDATDYRFTLSTDAGFANIIEDISNISTNNYTTTIALAPTTTYFWRVEATNTCGQINSTTFTFTTANIVCETNTNTTSVDISQNGTPTITSTIDVMTDGVITDLDFSSLDVTHSYIQDLIITLESPNGTSVILLDRICGNNNNINMSFDDESANTYGSIPCAPTGGLDYQPNQALSAFDGESMLGTWTLTIEDRADQDGGSLNAWSMFICATVPSNCLPNASITGAQSSGSQLVETSQNITSVEIIGGTANIEYSAGVDICLNAGFEVGVGAEFHAYILGCTPFTAPSDDVQRLIVIENDDNESIGVNLNLDTKETVSIRLLDYTGQVQATVFSNNILEKGTHEVAINTSDIKAGIYFCEIQIGTEVLTEKIVISK